MLTHNAMDVLHCRIGRVSPWRLIQRRPPPCRLPARSDIAVTVALHRAAIQPAGRRDDDATSGAQQGAESASVARGRGGDKGAVTAGGSDIVDGYTFTLPQIERHAAKHWPEWAACRYRLVGADAQKPAAPTPEEAARILDQSVRLAVQLPRNQRLATYPQHALVAGAVEALRLTPPRGGSASATGTVPTLGPANVTRAFYVLASIGNDCWWVDEMDALCEHIPTAELHELRKVRSVLMSLRQARHWTPHLALLESRAVEAAAAERAQHGASPWMLHQISQCAVSLITLGHSPDALFGVAKEVLAEGHWEWRAAARLARALALAGEVDGPAAEALLEALAAQEGSHVGRTTSRDLMRLWQFGLTLRQARPQRWLELQRSGPRVAQLLGLAEDTFNRSVRALQSKRPPVSQKEVLDAVLSLGFEAVMETTAAGVSVDIALPGERVAIEVQGITHFARNRPELEIGNSRWKRALLEASGWAFVAVKMEEFDTVRGPPQRRHALSAMITAALEARHLREQE